MMPGVSSCLGRSLERVDMLARLLSTEVATTTPDVDWVILLRSCSAHEAFLRTYRREPEPALAAEFLLRDRLFPRSMLCALSTAEDCLAELDPGRNRAGTHRRGPAVLGRVRTHLEFRPIDDMLHDLSGPLAAVQAGLRARPARPSPPGTSARPTRSSGPARASGSTAPAWRRRPDP